MRDLSAEYKTSASSNARNYTILLHVLKKTVDDNGNVSFPSSSKATYTSNDSLISMSIVDGQTSGNSFQLGQTFCPIISFSTVPNLNIKTGDKVQVELVFTSAAKATLATGYVDEYSYDSIDYAVSYTAYGKMLQLDKDYNSALTYPATFSAIVNEICSQNGLTFDTFTWKCNAKLKAKPIFGNLDNGDPAYASAREMLGIIAGVNGCNVIITADEKVKFVPYTDTKTGITYEDAFSRQVNNEKYIIKKAVLNDGGQTSGDEAGYVELYFPLETVEGKASCLEKLNSVITGLSVMGMTVQIQGRGYYEIGDMLSYTDFDGEKYTIGVMGIKYDFGGGYFTETLYSLAPSEMEEQYKGNVRYSSSRTTIKNPVVISENTSSYLGYQYHTIGYRKGDKITYGLNGGNVDIIVQGYRAAYNPGGLGTLCGDFNVVNGIHAIYTTGSTPFTKLSFYLRTTRVIQYPEYTVYYINLISEYTTKDGETVKKVERSVQARNGNFGTALMWEEIIPPSTAYPNGYAVILYGINYHNDLSSKPEVYTFASANRAGVSFSSIAEYNAAVQLSGESLTMYDVTQDVMKIGEADEPTDLPTTGDVDTLYITYQPPACWKYSTITNKYYCVGRDYRELQRIKSSTEASTALEVFNVPVIFDCRTKTEWDLEANTVYPKGFMVFEQNPESREVTRLKIANGIDKLSDLQYTNAVKSDIPTKTSQLENDSGFLTEETDPTVPAWAKAKNKPSYTADEVGAAAKSHTHTKSQITDFPASLPANGGNADTVDGKHASDFAADITAAVNAISIGGRNLLPNTNDMSAYTRYGEIEISADGEGYCVATFNKQDTLRWDMVGSKPNIKYSKVRNSQITISFEYRCPDESGWIEIPGEHPYPILALCTNNVSETSVKRERYYSIYDDSKPKTTASWQKYTSTITVTDSLLSLGSADVVLSDGSWFFIQLFNHSTNGLQVRKLKLEVGNKPTDWTPAPEDDERRIASLEARVAALEAAAVSGGE